MTAAKIIKKIDIKATLEAMPSSSVLRLHFKVAKYHTVYSAVKALPNFEEYVVAYDSDNLSTIIRRK